MTAVEREVLLQIFFHVVAMYEPVRCGSDPDGWRALNWFRYRYPTHGCRFTSVMAGIQTRAHFHDAIKSLKQKQLIRERKSGATKQGNSFWLTSTGLDACCLLAGLDTVYDTESLVGLLAYHQCEHEPDYRHTWVNERCLLQSHPDWTKGQLQSALAAPMIAGLVLNECDPMGRAAYRVSDTVFAWMWEKFDAWHEAAKMEPIADEMGVDLHSLTPDEMKWTLFRHYLKRYFDFNGLGEYERFPESERPEMLEAEYLWSQVDRAKENVKGQVSSMPATEIGSIPLSASGAPWINYGHFEDQPDLYKLRDHRGRKEKTSEIA